MTQDIINETPVKKLAETGTVYVLANKLMVVFADDGKWHDALSLASAIRHLYEVDVVVTKSPAHLRADALGAVVEAKLGTKGDWRGDRHIDGAEEGVIDLRGPMFCGPVFRIKASKLRVAA